MGTKNQIRTPALTAFLLVSLVTVYLLDSDTSTGWGTSDATPVAYAGWGHHKSTTSEVNLTGKNVTSSKTKTCEQIGGDFCLSAGGTCQRGYQGFKTTNCAVCCAGRPLNYSSYPASTSGGNYYGSHSVCVDTDGGQVASIAGTTTAQGGTEKIIPGASGSCQDSCMDSTTLYECYCDLWVQKAPDEWATKAIGNYHETSVAQAKGISITCSKGCSNGACIV